MPLPDGTVTDKDCACLDEGLRYLAMARQIFETCTDCGLDVGDRMARLKATEQLVTRLKGALFPNRT